VVQTPHEHAPVGEAMKTLCSGKDRKVGQRLGEAAAPVAIGRVSYADDGLGTAGVTRSGVAVRAAAHPHPASLPVLASRPSMLYL
jgi:hypothetical protein